MTPRLSVIIPTYNRAKLVCRAVASVLDQSQGKPVEVIVVDDGSTDSSVVELQKTFAAAISQKQLIILKETHLGDCGAARNRAIPHAQGEILAFLDSDDQWLPGRVDRLIKTFESADLVLCPEQMPSSQDQKD